MPKLTYLKPEPQEISCLDCMNCKLTDRWTKLKCSMDMWEDSGYNCRGNEVKLSFFETKKLKFKMRNIFRKAKECQFFLKGD